MAMLRTGALVVLVSVVLCGQALAQQIMGFPREDFGKIALSTDQVAGDDGLEVNVGAYNNEPISAYGKDSPFAKLGRAIGRLDVLTDAGVFPCTAFLISDKYVLTNHHCVPGIVGNTRAGATRIEAVQLVLGYWVEGVEDDARRFNVSLTPIESDADSDFSVLEVFGGPSREFGVVRLASGGASGNYPYWIIGHPMGEAQRISREKCKSSDPALSGGRLRHTCDTLPGNSGSPVIDPAQQAAVALHHAGSKRNSINYAIPLGRIAERSKIVRELLNGSAPNSVASTTEPTKTAAIDTTTPVETDTGDKSEAIGGHLTLSQECREVYEGWRRKASFGAFAAADNGACGWNWGSNSIEIARREALRACREHSPNCEVIEVHSGNEGDWTVSDNCKKDLASWRTKASFGAFAVSQAGACGWNWGSNSAAEARRAALQFCSREGKGCKVIEEHSGNKGDWTLSDDCKSKIAQWRNTASNGAFAISQNGYCGYSYGFNSLATARQRALQECHTRATPCQVIETR